jgi:ABC-type transport system involved in cytochrome c biogenesis permease subunit
MAEISLVATLAAFVASALSKNRPIMAQVARGALGVAAVALLGKLVWRSLQLSFPAMTRSYEGLSVFALAFLLALIFLNAPEHRPRRRVVTIGSFLIFLLLALLSSPLVPSELRPPVPALRSHWLVLHVAFSFIGLALFTLGTLAAILAFRIDETVRNPYDRLMDEAVALGFVFYVTGGLVFGAIWAEAAWGRFWGWDPKETWALITSLSYTAYLHLRYIKGVSPKMSRALVIVSWVLAGFTYIGVNTLMPGLHSYA